MTTLSSTCPRCGNEITASIVSRFSIEDICLPCSDRERAHPRYAEAVAKEEEEIRRGNFNFAGIGKPPDL